MRSVRSESGGPSWSARAIVFSLLAAAAVSCQSAIATPTAQATLPPVPTASPAPQATMPSVTAAALPTSRFAATPGPTLLPLSEADAIALIREEILRYGVTPEVIRVSITGEPRTVAVRFATTLSMDQTTLDYQRILSTMAVARIAVRLQPPPAGGISVSIIPAGQTDVGLLVTVVGGDALAEWARGELNDPEFYRRWKVGAMTRE
jgi:hypothetical protein